MYYALEEFLISITLYVLGPMSLFIIPIATTSLYSKNRKSLMNSSAPYKEGRMPLSAEGFLFIMFLAEVPILLAFYLEMCFSIDWAWIILLIDIIILLKVAKSLYEKNISNNMNGADNAKCMTIEQFFSKVLVAEAIVIAIFFLYIGAFSGAVMMSV